MNEEREKLREALKRILVDMIQRNSNRLIIVDYETTIDYILAALSPAPTDGEAHAEIQRLQDAKRRALAIADERAKENVALRGALKNLLDAAKLMPRTTPKPGGAGTVHDYKIEAAYVWGLDRMCMAADTALSNAPPASEGVRVIDGVGRDGETDYDAEPADTPDEGPDQFGYAKGERT